jgi:hypothetical protein
VKKVTGAGKAEEQREKAMKNKSSRTIFRGGNLKWI